MVATSTLLKLTPLQWNQSLSYKQHRHHPNIHFFSEPQGRSNFVRLKIVVKYKQSTYSDTYARSDTNRSQIWIKSSFDKTLIQIKKTLDSLKRPVIAMVLFGLLLLCDHHWALAASGGRIGGKAFSSRSRSSKSSSSSSTKSPSSSSASSYSFTRSKNSAPSRKSASSSKDSASPKKSAKSSWVWAPSLWDSAPSSSDLAKSSWDSEPSFWGSAPESWDSAQSSWDSAQRSLDLVERSAQRSWDLAQRSLDFTERSAQRTLDLALSSRGLASPRISNSSFNLIIIGLVVSIAFAAVCKIVTNLSENDILTNTQKTSVLRLQVGLLGSARNLQQDFNHLAETADTSTPEGLSYVLTEATLALLRHPDYCISCYSTVDVKQCIEEGEKQFNQLSVEERGKFDEETLVNVNNIKIHSSKIHRASGLNNEYIVVTILVAAEGTLKLQTIKGSGDLKEALHKLGSIPSNKIMAVEVLWTPQNEKDVLSERELLEDYPLLRPF